MAGANHEDSDARGDGNGRSGGSRWLGSARRSGCSAGSRRPWRRGRDMVDRQDQRRCLQRTDAPAVETIRSQADARGPEQLAGTDHQGSRAGCDLQLGGARKPFHRAPAPRHADRVRRHRRRSAFHGRRTATGHRVTRIDREHHEDDGVLVRGGGHTERVVGGGQSDELQDRLPGSRPSACGDERKPDRQDSVRPHAGSVCAAESVALEPVRRRIRQVRSRGSERSWTIISSRAR